MKYNAEYLMESLNPTQLEKEVLGAILVDSNCYDSIATILKPEDFSFDAHQHIYSIMQFLADQNKLDLTLVVEELKKRNLLELVGGELYLGELMQGNYIPAHVGHYAKRIKSASLRRKFFALSDEITELAVDKTAEVEQSIAQIDAKLLAMLENEVNGLTHIKDVVIDAYHELDRMTYEGDSARCIPTGFKSLDDLIGGFRKSELIIIAARPGMGKTALATNIAEYMSVELSKTILYISLEMNRIELGFRLLCERANVSNDISRRLPKSWEIHLLTTSGDELSKANFFIDDTSSRTVSEIASIARLAKRKQNLDALFIDYIGLIQADDQRVNRQEQIATITRRLKLLAKELEIPVVALSQLNRQLENEEDKRPKLAHLRESGAIEQDADVVIFVHRPEQFVSREEAEDKNLIGKAEIIVAKQRAGSTGTANLLWKGELCKFINNEYDEEKAQDFFNDLPEFNKFDESYSENELEE